MQGKKIEGLLTEVPGGDKTFFRTEIGFPFMIYPGNIVMGMPGRELGVLVGIPQLSSEYHIDEILGVYNFFQCAGTPGSLISEYRMSFGTLKLLNTGNHPTWESKNNGNLSDIQVLPDKKGSWIDQGKGIIYLLDATGRKVANLFIHPLDTNNKILVIDLCEKNISGVQLGVKQRPLTATEIAGNYKCLSIVHYEAIDIAITETQIIVPKITDAQIIAHNSPWNGFIQTKDLIVLPTAGAERNLYFGGTKSDSAIVPTFSTGIEKPFFYGEQ